MFDILTYISVVSYFIVRTDLIKTFNILLDINIMYIVQLTMYRVSKRKEYPQHIPHFDECF